MRTPRIGVFRQVILVTVAVIDTLSRRIGMKLIQPKGAHQ
jgi:hypothetical protein